MAKIPIHYGWPVSPYSAKTRSYLTAKNIPFREIAPTIFTLTGTIKRAVGKPVMPTVYTGTGQWLQDTSDIIDYFELLYPEPPAIPHTPKQHLAALLIEVFADEWVILPALYLRWSLPANRDFALSEFGRYSLPLGPRFLQRRLGEKVAAPMRRYLPMLGLNEQTGPGLTRFAEQLIHTLDTHLHHMPYLLGHCPSIADFSLYGPLYAHLYRDPATTVMFASAPAVVDWLQRLARPISTIGHFAPDDEVPTSLLPLFQQLFTEQWPWLETTVQKVNEWCAANPGALRVPRALGNAAFTLGGSSGERKVITYQQWMVQRPWSYWNNSSGADREALEQWLAAVGGENLCRLPLHNPLIRRDYQEWLQQPASSITDYQS